MLAGLGNLGKALMQDESLTRFGLRVVAVFDVDAACVGSEFCGVPVLHVREMTAFCQQQHVRMGILTLPKEQAQQVLDDMALGGVQTVWSFVSAPLIVPQGVYLQQENMNGTLAILTQHIKNNL